MARSSLASSPPLRNQSYQYKRQTSASDNDRPSIDIGIGEVVKLDLNPPQHLSWTESDKYAREHGGLLPTQQELELSEVRPRRSPAPDDAGPFIDEWHPVRRTDGRLYDWVNIGTWIDGNSNYISHYDHINNIPPWHSNKKVMQDHDWRDDTLLYVFVRDPSLSPSPQASSSSEKNVTSSLTITIIVLSAVCGMILFFFILWVWMHVWIVKKNPDASGIKLHSFPLALSKTSTIEKTEHDKDVEKGIFNHEDVKLLVEQAKKETEAKVKKTVFQKMMQDIKIEVSLPKIIDVDSNQFLTNGEVIDLPPSGNITRPIAEAVCELILHAARNGSGEKQPCKGMLVLVGSENQFQDFGYVQGTNKFDTKEMFVQDWKENEAYILGCFLQDLAMFVDGQSGKILADWYKVDLPTRDADHNGGSKHVSASAAGMNGCLAIKCSEDCCLVDGRGKGTLKVFSNDKIPCKVPVAPVFTPDISTRHI